MADNVENSPNDNVKELQGNFEQQQAMIGQLRDMLKQKETNKLQDKDAEDYATRLAKMKPRLLRGKGRGRAKIKEEKSQRLSRSLSTVPSESTFVGARQIEAEKISSTPQPDFIGDERDHHGSDAAVSSTISVLPEPLTTVSSPTSVLPEPLTAISSPISVLPEPLSAVIPSAVDQAKQSPTTADSGNRSRILLLRKQLEENRLKFERQQRENIDKRAAMKDMMERLEEMKTEIVQRDTEIQSLKDGDTLPLTDVNMQQLYQQILQKDNCLFDLTDKVQHLESAVHDQKEQLDEKDQVIVARTEAVTLIAKDRDEKMIKAVEELEEIRVVMRNMQSSFTDKEEIWHVKEDSLSVKIDEQHKKVVVLEENCQRIENIRFELSARNAELQEKVVGIQCDAEILRKEVSTFRIQNDDRSNEIKDLKARLVRAESFGQKKLKSLEKQVKSLSKNNDVGEKILELENNIAELEEEKGNLQLKLIDFGELKASSDQLNHSLKTMETKLDQLNNDCLSQMSSVSNLEKQKINLVNNLNEKSLKCNSNEEELTRVCVLNEELKQMKVTQELRLCVLEEERDEAIKAHSDLEKKQIPDLNIEDKNIEIAMLQEKIKCLDQEIIDKDCKLGDYENIFTEKDSITQLAIQEKENKLSENQCLISMLAEKENDLTVQVIALEKDSATIASKETKIEEMVLKSKEDELEMQSLYDSISQSAKTCAILNTDISTLQEQLLVSETKIDSMKKSENDLNLVLKEKEKTILILEGDICTANDEVSKKSVGIDDQIKKIEQLRQLLDSREDSLRNLEISYSNQEIEKLESDAQYKKLEQDIINTQKYLKETESRLGAECEMISCLLSDRDNQVVFLEQEIKIKNQSITNNQIMISKFEGDLCAKNRVYDDLLIENESLLDKISFLQTTIDDHNSLIITHTTDINYLHDSCEQKNSLIDQLENEKITNLEHIQLLEGNSTAIDEKVSNLEKELRDIKSSIESKNDNYQQLQMEFQAFNCNKENELAHMSQIMDEKEAEINSLKVSFITSSELSMEEVKKWQLEFNEKCEQVSLLEKEVSQRNHSISDNHCNIEIKCQEIQILEQQLVNLQNEIIQQNSLNELQTTKAVEQFVIVTELKKQAEESLMNLQCEMDDKNKFIISLQSSHDESEINNKANIQSIQELQSNYGQINIKYNQLIEYYENNQGEEAKLHMSLNEELNQLKILHQNELLNLRGNIDERDKKLYDQDVAFSISLEDMKSSNIQLEDAKHNICQLELIIATSNNKLKEAENVISQLQAAEVAINDELGEAKNKIELINFTISSELPEAKLRINELEMKNVAIDDELKQAKLQINQFELINIPPTDEVDEIESKIDRSSIAKSDELEKAEKTATSEKLEMANNTISQLEILNLATNNELKEAKTKIRQLEMGGIVSEKSEPKSSFQPAYENIQTESVSAVDFFDQFQPIDDLSLLKENETLKDQLNSAQQAIVMLETSLATQAEHQSDSSQDTVESWGVVDLGEPSILGTDPMTSSLIEKDKILTVIQEQLKEALEQVNTVSDSKKLIQHQMKTLEAELTHSKNVVSELKSEITSANKKIEMLIAENASFVQKYETLSMTLQQSKEHSTTASAQPFDTVMESFVEVEKTQSSSFFDNLEYDSKPECKDVSNEVSTPSEIVPNENVPDINNVIQDLQYKLSWYEENWASWSIHCNQLQNNLEIAEEKIKSLDIQQEIVSSSTSNFEILKNEHDDLQHVHQSLLQENINLKDKIQNIENDTVKLIEANQELDRLRPFETQVSELSNQIMILRQETLELETKVTEISRRNSELQNHELLYTELQNSMQEVKTEKDGIKSREQELELMVQSAETEIDRLRIEITTLTNAANLFVNEKATLQEEIVNEKEELRKCNVDKQTFEAEMSRLQNEASSLSSQLIEFHSLIERKNADVEQLRSEIEVLEGDADRLRTSYEIVESEHNRIRSEQEISSQNSQMLGAQNESLETEIQRLHVVHQSLSLDSDHSRGEMQRLSEVGTSAESEISRLQIELNELRYAVAHYQELELQNKQQPQKEILLEEELDWSTEGKMEIDHLRQSSSVERNLQEELDQLRQRSIELERERNLINDELQTFKVKNGKMIQKLKAANNKNENLNKELNKLNGGGFSELDQALEEEMKAQVKKAECYSEELKIKLDEMEKEKYQMYCKIEVLENAHEKFVEMKELQDVSMRHVSVTNKNLESKIATLEWKLAEIEETHVEQIESISKYETSPPDAGEINTLKQTIHNQEQQIVELTNERIELETNVTELETKLEELSLENDNIQALMNNVNEAKKKLDSDVISYKTSFIDLTQEHENLKEQFERSCQEVSDLKTDECSMQVSYETLTQQFIGVQENMNTFKYERGIFEADRDKFEALSMSLNNQLEVMRTEERDDVLAAIQDACSELREENIALKDEMTKLTADLLISEEALEDLRSQFEKHFEDEEILHHRNVLTLQANKEHEASIERLTNELKYMKAELASYKMKYLQQEQALEEVQPELIKVKKELTKIHHQNSDLKKQLDVADGSLTKLTTQGDSTELDATLMTLHLRDLRCQQLSLEINKLLEERDSLQLKLSASLRQSQELSRELHQNHQLSSSTTPPPSLNEKLLQLRELNSGLEDKAMNYFNFPGGTRPPTFPTFISHTAPSTPTATRHADYTVIRENQGSSGTLMDWIMGKSPPKEILHV